VTDVCPVCWLFIAVVLDDGSALTAVHVAVRIQSPQTQTLIS
jgi:hypothetical protein